MHRRTSCIAHPYIWWKQSLPFHSHYHCWLFLLPASVTSINRTQPLQRLRYKQALKYWPKSTPYQMSRRTANTFRNQAKKVWGFQACTKHIIRTKGALRRLLTVDQWWPSHPHSIPTEPLKELIKPVWYQDDLLELRWTKTERQLDRKAESQRVEMT